MTKIRIPHDWQPRAYQMPLWNYLEAGGRRACVVWHRRSGKDSVALNFAAASAVERVGVYYHMAPEASHARKIAWDGIDGAGRRVIDQAFPRGLREATNDNEMKIRLANGSVWQVVGSDNYDALVGTNPVGIVFSEYSRANPQSWEFMRPILAENNGWALFISTPVGQNHFADMYDMAKRSPDWFAQILTADDTQAISAAAIEAERQAGMPEAMIKQEFYCSFLGNIAGAYYGEAFERIERDNRICRVPWEPSLPVNTAWDLGIDDQTAIWFFQRVGKEIRLIDYYEASGVGLEHYVKVLREQDYSYGDHLLPHDVEVTELSTGRSRKQMLKDLGLTVLTVPKVPVGDGINAARSILSQCCFDAEKCQRGIKALKSYRTEFDHKSATFRMRPLHDWTSHAADAFRYLAVGLKRVDGRFSSASMPLQRTAILGHASKKRHMLGGNIGAEVVRSVTSPDRDVTSREWELERLNRVGTSSPSQQTRAITSRRH